MMLGLFPPNLILQRDETVNLISLRTQFQTDSFQIRVSGSFGDLPSDEGTSCERNLVYAEVLSQ